MPPRGRSPLLLAGKHKEEEGKKFLGPREYSPPPPPGYTLLFPLFLLPFHRPHPKRRIFCVFKKRGGLSTILVPTPPTQTMAVGRSVEPARSPARSLACFPHSILYYCVVLHSEKEREREREKGTLSKARWRELLSVPLSERTLRLARPPSAV